MSVQPRSLLRAVLLSFLFIHFSHSVCVDVPSDTEAVVGQPMKLTCIFCMKREEVSAKTRVQWSYRPPNNGSYIPIYLFKNEQPQEVGDGPLQGRLEWNGSKDLQDISLRIVNVTFNDSGTYRCEVFRQFAFDFFTPSISNEKIIELTVREKASEDITALYSEIMMYVLLVFLTFWLLVEMVYCYRKISKSDEQAQDTVTNYLAIPSEQKDNLAAPVTE